MRFLRLAVAGVLAIASLAYATPVETDISKRQASVTTVYKFSGSAWVENIAVRPNGQILLTRLDAPELWTLDPTTKAASKLFTFSSALCSAGITEVTPDVFAVLTGNFTTRGTNVPGAWAIWKVDFTGAKPNATLVNKIADSQLFNGITTLNNDTILIGDGGKGALFRFSLSTGASSIAFSDTSMAPPSSGGGFSQGIDGLKYRDGVVYFTNIFKNTLNKVPVDATGKNTGAVTLISNTQTADDLAIGTDGSLYVALQNKIIKVDTAGKTTTVANTGAASACAFGRTEKDKNILYVTLTGGSVVSVPVTQ